MEESSKQPVPGPESAHVPSHESKPKQPKRHSWLYIGIIVAVAALVFGAVWWLGYRVDLQNSKITQDQSQFVASEESTEDPKLTGEPVIENLDHVWEIVFLPTSEMLFTERSGKISLVKNGNTSVVAQIDDVFADGEGGLMGMATDPDFTNNRYLYTCFNSTKGAPDVRVVRWKLKTDLNGLEDRKDIVTGMPSNPSGRHSGCRIGFGPDGYLWIGTGDAARGDTGIQPKSLGGKVLRVDRDGNAAPGNLGGEYDERIYSYGHRNIQGLAFYKSPVNDVPGVSVEHGSTVDDEVNLLQKGNFGWAPSPTGYSEKGVPMTDKTRFPDAIESIWKSGSPTQAPSGATFVSGKQWKAWDGSLVVAILKNKHLKFLALDDNKITREVKTFEGTYGRIRTATQGPDGNLYIGTDNGGNDKIIRIIPN